MPRSSPWFDRLLLLVLLASIGFGAWKQWGEIPVSKPVSATLPPAVPLATPAEPFSASEMEAFQKLKLMHVTGNYEGALKFAESLLVDQGLSEAFREWLHRQLSPLMAAVAWLRIRTGECDEALKILYKAVRIQPILEVKKGLGYCLHQTKNWPEAASWLADYVLASPDDIGARMIYADALESLGRYDEAVTMLEGAVANTSAPRAELEVASQRLAAMRVKSREGRRQQKETSRRFFVSFREEEHETLLPGVFETLEAALDEYAEVLAVAPSEAPIEVVLYRKEAFRDVVPGGPEWSEGVFDGRIRVPLSKEMAADPKGLLMTVLRHELVHAVLSHLANGRRVPTWLDEGLAQYLACRNRSCAGSRFPATPGAFSEQAFLTEPFITLSSIDAGRAYAHSLYLIRMVVADHGEEALRKTGLDWPPRAELTSDLFAKIFGYADFATLVKRGSEFYQRRTSL